MIITPNDLQGTMVNANLDDLYLQNAINEAEGVYLREILGDLLYNAIINKINNQTLTGKYATLVDQYIKIYLQYKAQSLLVPQVAFKIRNAGVISQYDQGFSTTSVKDTMYVQEQIDSKAEFYANRLTVYLQKNADSFPEYGYSDDNITQPTESQNVTTIYLGTGRKKCGCSTPSSGGGSSSVDWDDIQNKPDFAEVATSGSYNDLEDTPDIPTVNDATINIYQGNTLKGSFSLNQENGQNINLEAGGSGSTDWSDIQNKPDFAEVATSGDYNDLQNKPTIPTVNNATLTIKQGGTTKGTFTANAGTDVEIDLEAGSGSTDWNDITNKPNFATVATSGSYNDLTNKPTIPTKTSELTNDSGFTTFSGSYNDLRDIPNYFSYIGDNTTGNGVKFSGQTEFGDRLDTDISAGVFCNFKVDLAQSTKLYSDYIITGENTNGRNELVVSGDDGNNVYGKIAKDGIYEGNTKLENKYLQINDLPTNVSAFTNDAGYLTQHQSLAGYATETWVGQQGYSTFSGDYNDLTNKPTIPTVPTNVSAFTNDAGYTTFSGDYNDLTNKPSIPAAQVNSDWNANSGVAQILNKPSLATVATSGNYNDLTNKPTIPAAPVQSDWSQTDSTALDYIKNKPTVPSGQIQSDWNQTNTSSVDYIKNKPNLFSGDYNDLTNKPSLATVATSGDYDDLTNKPTIPVVPTNVSAFTNDAGYSTFSGSYNDLTNKPSIPAAQVQTDWNANSGMGQLLNKPSMTTETWTFTLSDNTTVTKTVWLQPTV